MADGLFIVLEGIDGAGTTTQAVLLGRWLEAEGRRVTLTAEPTTGPVGEFIRRILRGDLTDERTGEPVVLNERAMALLFAADRSYHVQSIILPALESGSVVVSDRYYLSSVAYQGLEVDMGWVEALNSAFLRPDLTIMFDISPDVSLRRKYGGGVPPDRYERVQTLQKVHRNYHLAIAHARSAGERIEILDGARAIHPLAARIQALVAPLLANT